MLSVRYQHGAIIALQCTRLVSSFEQHRFERPDSFFFGRPALFRKSASFRLLHIGHSSLLDYYRYGPAHLCDWFFCELEFHGKWSWFIKNFIMILFDANQSNFKQLLTDCNGQLCATNSNWFSTTCRKLVYLRNMMG